jgi:hypothetical protein
MGKIIRMKTAPGRKRKARKITIKPERAWVCFHVSTATHDWRLVGGILWAEEEAEEQAKELASRYRVVALVEINLPEVEI